MSSPENPESAASRPIEISKLPAHEQAILRTNGDDFFIRSMGNLRDDETRKRRAVHARLQQEAARVLLMTDSQGNHSSYHHTMITKHGSSFWRSVVVRQIKPPATEIPFFQAMVNDEGPDPDSIDGRIVEMYDYTLSLGKVSLAHRNSILTHTHHEHEWAIPSGFGPYIHRVDGDPTINLVATSDYHPTPPALYHDEKYKLRETLAAIANRFDMEDLLTYLGELNATTHESTFAVPQVV